MSISAIIEWLDSAYWQLSTYGDEEIDLESLPDEIADLWSLRQEIMLAARALQAIRSQVEERIANQLEKGEAVNVEGEIVRYKPSVKLSIHDEQKFWSFVQSLPPAAITLLFNPNSVRIGALKQFAASELGMDAETIEDTFFLREFQPAKVEAVPIDKAPKWAQQIPEGERKVSPYVNRSDD